MSSDEEDGSPRKLRKRLAWGSERLKLEKAALDEHHMAVLADGRVRNAMTKYKGLGSLSTRQIPKDAPLWAIDHTVI
jgi:hypothetical protein